MRRLWKDKWKPGIPERESFDDLDAIVSHETLKETLYVNVGSINTAFEVLHSLKKVPTLFYLTQSASGGTLYATEEDRGKWSDTKIVLRSTITGEVGICVQ